MPGGQPRLQSDNINSLPGLPGGIPSLSVPGNQENSMARLHQRFGFGIDARVVGKRIGEEHQYVHVSLFLPVSAPRYAPYCRGIR